MILCCVQVSPPCSRCRGASPACTPCCRPSQLLPGFCSWRSRQVRPLNFSMPRELMCHCSSKGVRWLTAPAANWIHKKKSHARNMSTVIHSPAVGILPSLQDPNAQITVLVPTNAAFAAQPVQRLNTSDTTNLQTVLRCLANKRSSPETCTCCRLKEACGVAVAHSACTATSPWTVQCAPQLDGRLHEVS